MPLKLWQNIQCYPTFAIDEDFKGGLRNLSQAILCVLVCWFSSAAHADQNDPRLDRLFQQLQETQVTERGDAITGQIWEIWHQNQDGEAKALLDRGVALMTREEFRSALVTFTRLTKLKPGFAEAWNRRATLLYLMGEFTLSIGDIKQTLTLEPRHFGAISGLGQIFLRQNRFREARDAFQEALDINPHLEGARINILHINKMIAERSI